MRYRRLDSNGDMVFGRGTGGIWRDVPDAVGQAIQTRLLLFQGEWFLDFAEGMPWGGFTFVSGVNFPGQVLGANTQGFRDLAIKTRVLETEGVLSISNYASSVDSKRNFTASMVVDTIFGAAQLQVSGQQGVISNVQIGPFV